MSKTTEMGALRHPELTGVEVYPLGENPQKGENQEVLVIVEPEGIIPLHSHEVDARMFVVAGDAQLLSDDPQLNGQQVRTGTCVFFEKLVNHGFKAGKQGLRFLSRNGGIVDSHGAWDIKMAVAA
ncbi:hypothetical protein A2635_04235 [Candidatus Peribacteria bacterium RIFCSPHIGHO2_01_FULL_51_9]|nr:MAG: hypothetical protein A2635_04235 [Candidatus Peribacteria bacterium RIFCSPHIGHO2_01_FULL_51_9]